MTSVLLAIGTTAHAAFPGDNGKIAFSGGFGCGYESGAIASMNPDGTDLRVLIECDPSTSAPNWSSNGRSLLFTTYGTVWLMAADGSNRRQVSHGSAPSFAPDGRHYAYTRRRGVRRARLDGSHDRLLRRGRTPLWSPNGGTIAYVNRKGIWIMNARTGERLRRVASPRLLPLDWSPDGRRLLCKRYREELVDGVHDADLYTVRADRTGAPQRLTQTRRRSEHHAAWSPDGRQIVVAAITARRDLQHQRSIWTMSRDGTRRKRIWEAPAYDPEFDEDRVTESAEHLSWQPLTD